MKKMVVFLLLVFLAAVIIMCDFTSGLGGGACEDSVEKYLGGGSYTSVWFCYDFNDEEDCDNIQGSWNSGTSCDDLGYTYKCSTGAYAKSYSDCP